MVTEFPLIFLGLDAILLLWGFQVKKYALPGTIFGVAAFILLFTPIVRAYIIGNGLDAKIAKAFQSRETVPPVPLMGNYFDFFKMLQREPVAPLPVELTYYTSANTNLTLDYYRSRRDGSRPLVLVVHGGSWKGGDSHQLPELNSRLAALGYNIASINYRLAPDFHSPAPVDDIHAAITYLRQNAVRLGIDTTNWVLLGRSAGAQIVLASAYTQHEPGLRGVISFYGPADMIWGYKHPASKLVMNSCQIIEDYLGGTYDQMPDNYKQCSPIEWVNENTVPTLLLQGDCDPLVAWEHSVRLKEKLDRYHVPNYFLSLPWATHGFDFTLNGPGGQLSTLAVERFLICVCAR